MLDHAPPAAPEGGGFASGKHATPGNASFPERFRRHFSMHLQRRHRILPLCTHLISSATAAPYEARIRKRVQSLTAASMRVFISECKSAPVCYCCGDRENGLLSSGGGRLCGRRMPTRHVSICCRVRPKRVDPLRLCSACADGRLGCGSRGSIPRSGISGSGMLSRMARWAKCFL